MNSVVVEVEVDVDVVVVPFPFCLALKTIGCRFFCGQREGNVRKVAEPHLVGTQKEGKPGLSFFPG